MFSKFFLLVTLTFSANAQQPTTAELVDAGRAIARDLPEEEAGTIPLMSHPVVAAGYAAERAMGSELSGMRQELADTKRQLAELRASGGSSVDEDAFNARIESIEGALVEVADMVEMLQEPAPADDHPSPPPVETVEAAAPTPAPAMVYVPHPCEAFAWPRASLNTSQVSVLGTHCQWSKDANPMGLKIVNHDAAYAYVVVIEGKVVEASTVLMDGITLATVEMPIPEGQLPISLPQVHVEGESHHMAGAPHWHTSGLEPGTTLYTNFPHAGVNEVIIYNFVRGGSGTWQFVDKWKTSYVAGKGAKVMNLRRGRPSS